jgi:signal transduction histidine kinase
MEPRAEQPRARPRLTLLVKLVATFVVPTVILFSVFAFVAHEVQRSDLESELGRRLVAVAQSAATRLRGKYLVDLVAGDEVDNLYYAGGQKRLEEVKAATGVERIYVFDQSFGTRLDTSGAPIGSKQFQAEIDRQELGRVFDSGASASSLLFEGVDGKTYKAGYAPVYRSEDDREIVLAIGVDAPADFFTQLRRLRRQLVFYGALLALAVAAIASLVAVRITRPVRSLAQSADRIGAGDLATPIEVTSSDEIGLLAATMERMRTELGARDERMQLMLAGIAHEVRNPLGGIELFSGILRDELEGDDEKRAHVERIERELGHLKVVVESFLEYARRPAPELGRVELDELAREVIELESGTARAAQLEIRSELQAVAVRADSEQLRRVLLNLVRNAIQAGTGAGEPIRVELVAEAGWGRLSVHNAGVPISEEVMEHLFEPFFTTKEKGTGLGLAFVKEIIDDHGGRIEVASAADAGTRFTVCLPLDDNEGAASGAAGDEAT